MDRRLALKNLALIVGGAVLLPSCMHNDGTSYIQLKHITLNDDQQGLVGNMVETIIPKTNTPGAKDLNLPDFVLKMVDDCYDKKMQETFIKGLDAFTAMVETKYGKSFSDLDVKQRETVLTNIETTAKQNGAAKPGRKPSASKNVDADPLQSFYWDVKAQTIFGYTNSQYFMTKEIVYELVPGRYNAHFPVSKLKLKTA